MSNRLVTVGGITVGIAIVTYVVLNVVAPFKQHDEKLQGGAKVEDVFSGDVASAAVPAPAAPVAPASAAATAADVPDIATPPDNRAPPKPAAEAPPSKDAPEEGAVEIEGASDFPMPTDESTASTPAPAPEAAPEPAAAPAPTAVAAATAEAQATLPRPTPDPVLDTEAAAPPAKLAVAAPEPEASASEPEPTAAAAEPAAPAPRPAPKAATVAKSAPRADALTQWWPQPTAGKLNLLYAGQAANERTVGLLFDSSFAENAAPGDGLKLIADNGKPASGSWALNSNRRMLLFKNLKPGRYTVVVSPQLANEAGLAIGSELHGPVYVR